MNGSMDLGLGFLPDRVGSADGRSIFPRRPRASGVSSAVTPTEVERSEFARAVVVTIREALRAETARGAIRGELWVNETETLDARLMQALQRLERNEGRELQWASALQNVLLTQEVLRQAQGQGDLFDTLQMAPRMPGCTLLEYLEVTAQRLLDLVVSTPAARRLDEGASNQWICDRQLLINAARLLREDAALLRRCHWTQEGGWSDEHDTQAVYEEEMATAARLDELAARLPENHLPGAGKMVNTLDDSLVTQAAHEAWNNFYFKFSPVPWPLWRAIWLKATKWHGAQAEEASRG